MPLQAHSYTKPTRKRLRPRDRNSLRAALLFCSASLRAALFLRRSDALMTSSDHSTLSRHPSSAQRTSVAASRRSAPSWRALPMLTALFSSNVRSARRRHRSQGRRHGASSYATCHSTPPRERAKALPSNLGRARVARAQNQPGGVGQSNQKRRRPPARRGAATATSRRP